MAPLRRLRGFALLALALAAAAPGFVLGRRSAAAALVATTPLAARAELSPPLERATKRYGEQIQGEKRDEREKGEENGEEWRDERRGERERKRDMRSSQSSV